MRSLLTFRLHGTVPAATDRELAASLRLAREAGTDHRRAQKQFFARFDAVLDHAPVCPGYFESEKMAGPAQLPEGLRQFQQRLMSKLDDRDAWLNSMANALLSKSLTDFTDTDETRFQDKFQQSVHELDDLCDPATAAVNPGTEEFYRVRVAQFGQPEIVRNIRAPKSARKQTLALEKELRQLLATDKEQAKRVLGTLLAENLMP